mgnify:CR=1 FL=1
MKKKLAISVCSRHDTYMVSVEDENSGLRVTPSKCCGRWTTVREWELSERDWLDLAKEATEPAAIAR